MEDTTETWKNPPKLEFVIVYINTDGDWKEIWNKNFNADEKPFYLSPAHCIRYGDDAGAPALRYGERYSVLISSSSQGINHDYDAYFCVTKDSGNKPEARSVERNAENGQYNWQACATP